MKTQLLSTELLTPEENQENSQEEKKGFVYESLGRSNSQIRKDRGDDIAEELELAFKRDVEDCSRKVQRLERERRNMYDFSPSQTTSLVLMKDVKADEILVKDKAITLDIRNAKIELKLAQERYQDLFGKTVNL